MYFKRELAELPKLGVMS